VNLPTKEFIDWLIANPTERLFDQIKYSEYIQHRKHYLERLSKMLEAQTNNT
jgi:hypothetical protein